MGEMQHKAGEGLWLYKLTHMPFVTNPDTLEGKRIAVCVMDEDTLELVFTDNTRCKVVVQCEAQGCGAVTLRLSTGGRER